MEQDERTRNRKPPIRRSCNSKLVSVVNNLYSTRNKRLDVDSLIYCLARFKEELCTTQQELLSMFLRQGMKTHPDYSKYYEKYMAEFEGNPELNGQNEEGGQA